MALSYVYRAMDNSYVHYKSSMGPDPQRELSVQDDCSMGLDPQGELSVQGYCSMSFLY